MLKNTTLNWNFKWKKSRISIELQSDAFGIRSTRLLISITVRDGLQIVGFCRFVSLYLIVMRKKKNLRDQLCLRKQILSALALEGAHNC